MTQIGTDRSTGNTAILHGNKVHYERLLCTLQYNNALIQCQKYYLNKCYKSIFSSENSTRISILIKSKNKQECVRVRNRGTIMNTLLPKHYYQLALCTLV